MKYRVTIFWLPYVQLKSGRWVRRWKKFSDEDFESKARALKWVKHFTDVKSNKVTLRKL